MLVTTEKQNKYSLTLNGKCKNKSLKINTIKKIIIK